MMQFLTRPCGACPFRTDRHGFLGARRAQEIMDTLADDREWFACHKTVEYTDDGSCTAGASQCGGALIFQRTTARTSTTPRLNGELLRKASENMAYAQQQEHVQRQQDARAARWAQQPRFFVDFDSYVALFPDGERYRAWLTTSAALRIIQGEGPHGGLPGDYMWARIGYWRDESLAYVVGVHDCDDGFVVQQYHTLAEAETALKDLCELAPFALSELTAFGYRFAG